VDRDGAGGGGWGGANVGEGGGGGRRKGTGSDVIGGIGCGGELGGREEVWGVGLWGR